MKEKKEIIFGNGNCQVVCTFSRKTMKLTEAIPNVGKDALPIFIPINPDITLVYKTY